MTEAPVAPTEEVGGGECNLRAALRRCAERYHRVLADNLPLVRTLIGEIHRHQEHELRVLKGVFYPVKAAAIVCLERAHACGAIRPEVDPSLAADIFGGMILAEVLRRASPEPPKYLTASYLDNCVDIFARGIER